MKRWNQRTRKADGWVERRRRFQELFAESVRIATGGQVPVVADAATPEADPTIKIRVEP